MAAERDNTKTKRIKVVIAVGLVILALLNLYFLFLTARASQVSPMINQPGSPASSDSAIPSSVLTTPENSNPTEQADSSPGVIPLSSPEAADPVLKSPFSLQIAALHQVSIFPAGQDDETQTESSNEGRESSADGNAFTSLAEALGESGADWTRIRIEWELIEPREPVPGQPPTYDWAYHDVNLGLVAETGIRVIATLSDSPSWAASVPCAPIYAERLDDYARFLKDLVDRYKGPPFNIRHWELVNEPDSNRYISGQFSGLGCWAYDGEQYAEMLVVANQAIKEADPQATVLMGGIAYDWFTEYDGPFFRYFPDEVMFHGGGDHIDALNIHFFPDFSAEWDRWNPNSQDRIFGWIPEPTCGQVEDGIDTPYEVEGFDIVAKTSHFRNRMEVCFGVSKPVWITEVGMHGDTKDENSLISQARYVIKVYARALSAGVENITWFSLDQPPYDRYGQALLNPDFSPKPAFFAYQTLTTELDGFYAYSHSRNDCSWDSSGVSCLVEAYVFDNEFNDHKTVAWGSETLSFKTNNLRVVDRDGNEIIIKDGGDGDEDNLPNGIVKLQLTDEPLFLSTK